MKKLFHPFRALLIVLATVSVTLSANAEQQSVNEDQHVIIISIDGFPADALWDKRIPLPAIRSLAEDGAWANAMIPSTPTVTWPNHTSIVTGVHPEKHGVLTNGLFIRPSDGTPIYRENDVDREELTSYPALYDIAHENGLLTAEVNWPVTRNAVTLDYSFPDAVDPVAHTTPELRSELIELGILEDESEEAFRIGAVGRDYIWTKAATHLIKTRQPSLLLFHLLNVDGSHHGHGAQSNPGNTALAYADANIRMILDALDEAGIRDQTTIFLVSDHGFMNVTNRVQPNVLLRDNGLLEVDEEGNIVSGRVQVFSNGGSAMVFATNPETKDEDLEKARSLFEGAEGIARVLGPDEYESHGLPQPSENESMGDLVLGADNGYAFINAAGGEEYIVPVNGIYGTHGYFSDVPEMETIFIASGRGIRSGLEIGTVDNRSVAPTAATLLGLVLETAEGDILDEILE